MRTSLLVKLALVGLLSLSAVTASAKTTTASSSSSSSSSGPGRFALGFASYGGGSVTAGLAPSLSAWWEVQDKHALQFMAGITSSSPFNFGVGAIYRYTLLGDSSFGAHIGLGFSLGTAGGTAAAGIVPGVGSAFYMDILPVVGFHFNLGGALSRVKMSFNGGPILHITPGFQFLMMPSSVTLLGFAVHYTL